MKFEKQLLVIAVIVHIIAAWLSIGFHHPDEHFQIVEFANYKLGGTPELHLPWEFANQMRPGLQPFLAYLFLKPYYALGFKNPYVFTFILRLISGLLAIVVALKWHEVVKLKIASEKYQKLHLFLSLLGWSAIYIHVRFSSENFAAMAFVIGLFVWQFSNSKHKSLLFGIWAGLSFVFRFQAIFLIIGWVFWYLFIQKNKISKLLPVILGGVISIVFGLIFEFWLYGELTFSSWAYLEQNVIYNKASNFGTEPWYWYFEQIFNLAMPPFSIILLLSIPLMITRYKQDVIGWCVLFFILGHSVIGHKEFRFLFPLIYFVPYVSICTLIWIEEKIKNPSKVKYLNWGIQAFVIVNLIAMIFMNSKPANDLLNVNAFIDKNIKRPATIIYSDGYTNPNINALVPSDFFGLKEVKLSCIDSFMNDDTLQLENTYVYLFVEKPLLKDDFVVQYGGQYFDTASMNLIYSQIPQWASRFNFNNWIERSNNYKIYLLNKGLERSVAK
jgi:phosphatidylinositol glycan class B